MEITNPGIKRKRESGKDERHEVELVHHDMQPTSEFIENEKNRLFSIFEEGESFTFSKILGANQQGIISHSRLMELKDTKKHLEELLETGTVPLTLVEENVSRIAEEKDATILEKTENQEHQSIENYAYQKAALAAPSKQKASEYAEFIDDVSMYWETQIEILKKFQSSSVIMADELARFPTFYKIKALETFNIVGESTENSGLSATITFLQNQLLELDTITQSLLITDFIDSRIRSASFTEHDKNLEKMYAFASSISHTYLRDVVIAKLDMVCIWDSSPLFGKYSEKTHPDVATIIHTEEAKQATKPEDIVRIIKKIPNPFARITALISRSHNVGDRDKPFFLELARSELSHITDHKMLVNEAREMVVAEYIKLRLFEETIPVIYSIMGDSELFDTLLIRVATASCTAGEVGFSEKIIEGITDEAKKVRAFIALARATAGQSSELYWKKAEKHTRQISDDFLRMRALHDLATAKGNPRSKEALTQSEKVRSYISKKDKLYSVAFKEHIRAMILCGINPTIELIRSIPDSLQRDLAFRSLLIDSDLKTKEMVVIAEEMESVVSKENALCRVVEKYCEQGQYDLASGVVLKKMTHRGAAFERASMMVVDMLIKKTPGKAIAFAEERMNLDQKQGDGDEDNPKIARLLARVRRMCREQGFPTFELLAKAAKAGKVEKEVFESIRIQYEKIGTSLNATYTEKTNPEEIIVREMKPVWDRLAALLKVREKKIQNGYGVQKEREIGALKSLSILESFVDDCVKARISPIFALEKLRATVAMEGEHLREVVDSALVYSVMRVKPNALAFRIESGKPVIILPGGLPPVALSKINESYRHEVLLSMREESRQNILQFARENDLTLLMHIALQEYKEEDPHHKLLFREIKEKEVNTYAEAVEGMRCRFEAGLDVEQEIEKLLQSSRTSEIYTRYGLLRVEDGAFEVLAKMGRIDEMHIILNSFIESVSHKKRIMNRSRTLGNIENRETRQDSVLLNMLLSTAEAEHSAGKKCDDTLNDAWLLITSKKHQDLFVPFFRTATKLGKITKSYRNYAIKKVDIDVLYNDSFLNFPISDIAEFVPEIVAALEKRTSHYQKLPEIDAYLRFHLGKIYVRNGQTEKAEIFLNELHREQQLDLIREIGRAYAVAGNLTKAQSYSKKLNDDYREAIDGESYDFVKVKDDSIEIEIIKAQMRQVLQKAGKRKAEKE